MVRYVDRSGNDFDPNTDLTALWISIGVMAAICVFAIIRSRYRSTVNNNEPTIPLNTTVNNNEPTIPLNTIDTNNEPTIPLNTIDTIPM